MPRPYRRAITSLMLPIGLMATTFGIQSTAPAQTPVSSAPATLVAMSASAAAPMPRAAEPRWELRFETINELRLVEVGGEPYWFMTYLVTNRTNQDQTFVPSAVLYTDLGEIIPDDAAPYDVGRELLDLMRNPLLESRNEIIGVIQQGRENAREGMLVFPAGDLVEVDKVSVFIAGLSSETQVAINPETGEELVVRKTLELQYEVPGEPMRNPSTPVRFVGQRWVMR